MLPSPSAMNNIWVICTLCGNKLEKQQIRLLCFHLPKYLGNSVRVSYHYPCSLCGEIINSLIVEIFGKGYEDIRNPYTIKYVDAHHCWPSDCSLDLFDHIICKSEEYKVFLQSVEALCIWNKPDIKL